MSHARKGKADGCIIGEPVQISQELDLGIGFGSGGFVWAEIETRDVAAPGSLHQVGIDAITHMAPVLIALSDLKKRLLTRFPYHNPLADYQVEHSPSLHGSLIHGGTDLATYPERCVLSIERRMVFGEDFELVRAEFDRILTRALDRLPDLAEGQTTMILDDHI